MTNRSTCTDRMIKMNGSLQSIAAIRLGIEEENCKDGRAELKGTGGLSWASRGTRPRDTSVDSS